MPPPGSDGSISRTGTWSLILLAACSVLLILIAYPALERCHNQKVYTSTMHYFDPTLDWPKDLLEVSMPDLIVTHSRALKDPKAPWRTRDETWTTEWMQYAAAEGDNQFLNMTFLDSAPTNEQDRQKVSKYLNSVSSHEFSVHKYRRLSTKSNLPLLSSGKPLSWCESYLLTAFP